MLTKTQRENYEPKLCRGYVTQILKDIFTEMQLKMKGKCLLMFAQNFVSVEKYTTDTIDLVVSLNTTH